MPARTPRWFAQGGATDDRWAHLGHPVRREHGHDRLAASNHRSAAATSVATATAAAGKRCATTVQWLLPNPLGKARHLDRVEAQAGMKAYGTMKTITIAQDFSKFPAGRFRKTARHRVRRSATICWRLPCEAPKGWWSSLTEWPVSARPSGGGIRWPSPRVPNGQAILGRASPPSSGRPGSGRLRPVGGSDTSRKPIK